MYCAKNTANKGFTLIEIMLVVAVLAVLAALTIANYSTYASKARQGEAKIALAAIYAAERGFKGEFGSYIEDFRAIGYQPDGLKRHYTLGWRSMTVDDVVTGYNGGIGVPYYDYANIPPSWGQDEAGVDRCTITNARAGLNDAVTTSQANPQSFIVKARGVLRKGIDCDEWQMDDQKVLRNNVTSL